MGTVFALDVSLQFVLEEMGLNNQEVTFKTNSKALYKWLKGDMHANFMGTTIYKKYSS